MNIEEAILEKVRTLPIDRQQQVLDFVEFLANKPNKPELADEDGEPVSFFTATQKFAGCLDGGPSDLSTNKKYLEGLRTE